MAANESNPPGSKPDEVDLSGEQPESSTPTNGREDWSNSEVPTGGNFQVEEQSLNPELRMRFAQQVLLGAAIVGIICVIIAMFAPPFLMPSTPVGSEELTKLQEYILTMGTSIFGIVTTVIPPIITLVLGFYFGKKSVD